MIGSHPTVVAATGGATGGVARTWRVAPGTGAYDAAMVLEIADIQVRDGAQQAFLEAYAEARELVSVTPGCRSMRMTQGVETPTRFVLLVEWDSVEAHQVFRDSDRFGRWRELVGASFAEPPHVEHVTDVA